MLTPETQAMIQGIQQGQQQGQQTMQGQQPMRQAGVLPSAFQTQGRPIPTNPFEGPIDFIKDKLLEIAASVGQEGDAYKEIEVSLMKKAYELADINRKLTKIAETGSA
jgi:hypothetical protein